jgi:hypothetical protein
MVEGEFPGVIEGFMGKLLNRGGAKEHGIKFEMAAFGTQSQKTALCADFLNFLDRGV